MLIVCSRANKSGQTVFDHFAHPGEDLKAEFVVDEQFTGALHPAVTTICERQVGETEHLLNVPRAGDQGDPCRRSPRVHHFLGGGTKFIQGGGKFGHPGSGQHPRVRIKDGIGDVKRHRPQGVTDGECGDGAFDVILKAVVSRIHTGLHRNETSGIDCELSRGLFKLDQRRS